MSTNLKFVNWKVLADREDICIFILMYSWCTVEDTKTVQYVITECSRKTFQLCENIKKLSYLMTTINISSWIKRFQFSFIEASEFISVDFQALWNFVTVHFGTTLSLGTRPIQTSLPASTRLHYQLFLCST